MERIAPNLIKEALSLRKQGYTARSITALTGLPTHVLTYYFYKEKRKATMKKYHLKNRERLLKKMRDFSKKKWEEKKKLATL